MSAAKIKSYSLTDLATLYDIDEKTMRKWIIMIKDFGTMPRGKFNIKQVTRIFDHCGAPDAVQGI